MLLNVRSNEIQSEHVPLEAYKVNDKIRLVIAGDIEIILEKSFAKNICDLLAITAFEESIIGLIAKRRLLYDELETTQEKLSNCQNYYKRKKANENNKRAVRGAS